MQHIVETLASELQRSVAVDDLSLRLLSYSPHYGPVDPARLHSILHRRAAEPAIEYILGLGIREARAPLRIPADAANGVEERVCIPVRVRTAALGYLWLIDADGTLDDHDIAKAQAAADEIGAILFRDSLQAEAERKHERDLLRDLLSKSPELRHETAVALLEGGTLHQSREVACLVVQALGAVDEELLHLGLDIALAEVRRQLPLHRSMHLARADHGVLLVVSGSTPSKPGAYKELGATLHKTVMRGLSPSVGHTGVVVGVGESRYELVEAKVSYDHARLAARVATAVPGGDPVANWSELGAYRAIALLPPDELIESAMDPALLKLIESDRDNFLVTHPRGVPGQRWSAEEDRRRSQPAPDDPLQPAGAHGGDHRALDVRRRRAVEHAPEPSNRADPSDLPQGCGPVATALARPALRDD